MEIFLGPVLAVLFGTSALFKVSQQQKEIQELSRRIDSFDVEMSKKVIATMFPVAQAVKKLNDEVGL